MIFDTHLYNEIKDNFWIIIISHQTYEGIANFFETALLIDIVEIF